jgi:tetratricopeptide (TPR) repeat protein
LGAGAARDGESHELDPSDYEIEYHLAAVLYSMRRYSEIEEALRKNRPVSRMDANWEHLLVAECKLATGDLAAARAYLARVPPDFSPTAEIPWTRFQMALCLRDYDAAEHEIAATSPQWLGEVFTGNPPQTWDNGMLARLRGDEAKARAIFTVAREWTTTAWEEEMRDYVHFGLLSRCDAALGRKEDAIREARHVCKEWPLSRNPSVAKTYMQNLALVYALTGERAQAIDELEILAKMDDTVTFGDLHYSPYWDALRGDPRFEAIVASLAPKP